MQASTWLFTILVFTILTTVVNGGRNSSGGCGPEFQGKCTCGKQNYIDKLKFVVNCTDAGFKDTSMLEHMPNNTEVLLFKGNFIPELPWNVFGSINEYTQLEVVDMSNNHIREIRGKSYHHVPNVKRLILNHNNLSISDDDEDEYNLHHPRVFSNFINLMELHLTNAFADNTSAALSEDLHDIFVNSNLTKLTKLHLEQNEIVRFRDRNVFCDLPSLRDLHLGDNNLRELNFNVNCLKNLRFLDLERCKFANVRAKDMALMDSLQTMAGRTTNLTVDLSLNPFICDCSLAPFLNWIDATQVTVRHPEMMQCHHGKNGQPQAMLLFRPEKCRLQQPAASTGHVVVLAVLLTMFTLLLVGLVGAIIVKSRERIKNLMSPILDSVSKKVQYTTIKDEECQEVHV